LTVKTGFILLILIIIGFRYFNILRGHNLNPSRNSGIGACDTKKSDDERVEPWMHRASAI
jgi:hypothetical protein